MICNKFKSSSNVSMFYAVDDEPKQSLPVDITWKPVPFTSESIQESVTLSNSTKVSKTYHDSKLTQSEISGNISFEVFPGSFMENMVIASLQAGATQEGEEIGLHLVEGSRSWDLGETISNEKTDNCFVFLKRVSGENGVFDLFIYRGCKISSLSVSMNSESLVTAEVSIYGTGSSIYKSDSYDISGWTFENYPTVWLMNSSENFRYFTLYNDSAVVEQELQEISFSIDNQIRPQYVVGKGEKSPYCLASGRSLIKINFTSYFYNLSVYNALLGNTKLRVVFELVGDSGIRYVFDFPAVKVISGGKINADGPDSDLITSAEMQAFQNNGQSCLVTLSDQVSVPFQVSDGSGGFVPFFVHNLGTNYEAFEVSS